jgi:hypothetical protein
LGGLIAAGQWWQSWQLFRFPLTSLQWGNWRMGSGGASLLTDGDGNLRASFPGFPGSVLAHLITAWWGWMFRFSLNLCQPHDTKFSVVFGWNRAVIV